MNPFPNLKTNENFYKWFNGSKSIDDINKPIIFYHRSRSKEPFVQFTVDNIKKNPYNNCYGFYFVPAFQKHNISYIGDGIDVFAFLKYKNPFIIWDKQRERKIVDMNGKNYNLLDINESFCNEVRESGHDAIIVYNPLYYNQYIVFENNQIKSIDNNGLYSNDNNIFS